MRIIELLSIVLNLKKKEKFWRPNLFWSKQLGLILDQKTELLPIKMFISSLQFDMHFRWYWLFLSFVSRGRGANVIAYCHQIYDRNHYVESDNHSFKTLVNPLTTVKNYNIFYERFDFPAWPNIHSYTSPTVHKITFNVYLVFTFYPLDQTPNGSTSLLEGSEFQTYLFMIYKVKGYRPSEAVITQA